MKLIPVPDGLGESPPKVVFICWIDLSDGDRNLFWPKSLLEGIAVIRLFLTKVLN